MDMLRNVSIPIKLFLGFGATITMLSIIAIVSIYNLREADEIYVDYRNLARQTNANGRVQANMLMTRIFAKDFVIQPSNESIEGVKHRAQETIKLLKEAVSLIQGNVAYQVMLESIDNDLNKYVENFEKVTLLQDQRNILVNESLNKIGPAIEQNLTAIMHSALKDGDTEASHQAGITLRNLLLGRLYANRFLIQNDIASYQRATTEFRDMHENVNGLLAMLENVERQSLASEAEENEQRYESAFQEVFNVITTRNDLIKNELDRTGPKVAEEIEKLKLAIKSEQDELGPQAQKTLHQAVISTSIITLVSVLIGIFSAWLISSGITGPLRRISVTAKEIADGKLDTFIGIEGKDEIGQLAETITIMRDSVKGEIEKLEAEVITREKAENEALERRQVYMDAADPIIISDLSDNIVDANPEALRNFGYPLQEIISQPIKLLVPDNYQAEIDALLNKVKSGYAIRNEESVFVNNIGNEIPVLLTFSQLRNDKNKIMAIALFAKNITKQKAIEIELENERQDLEVKVTERTAEAEAAKNRAEELKEEAESASKAKANFLAAMSHEIRTPMNGIIGMVDLLRQSNLQNEHKQMLQTISNSGQSLLTIINDILDFSKIEAGKLELEEIPMNILDLVEDSVSTLSPLFDSKELEMVLYVDPAIPQFVTGDPVRMRQILINLGSNAIKFTDSGEVEIRAELVSNNKDDVTVQFSVRDQGIGISEEGQKKLFTAFSQAESSTTRKYGGTGLGLTICKRLTELMKGEIKVSSELGRGSEFIITIPFARNAKRIKQDKQSDLKGINALIFNDDDKEQFICQKYMEHWHANVSTLKDSGNHLSDNIGIIKQKGHLDIIIIGSGWSPKEQAELDALIRKDKVLKDIRIILLTQGKRTKPRLENNNTVTLDINPLKRVAFLAAVAIVTGRASPEVYHQEEVEDLTTGIDCLSIPEAINENALILVAEDNLTNQDVIKRQLTMLGYTCEIANDGQEALQAWETGKYFLLLTDCHMPEMDGYVLTGSIRKREESTGHRTPIIAITANALQGETDRCIEAGMDDYMSKPIDMRELRNKLHLWMPHFIPSEKSTNAEPPKKKLVSNRANAPIDEQVLKNVFGDDAEMLKEILNEFVQPTLNIIEEINLAHQKHSADDIKKAAHKLRSSARSVGANSLADLCTTLETAGQSKDWDTIDDATPQLDKLMTAVETHINKL
jgi:two-component system, sensor histidine kinase and response regulator